MELLCNVGRRALVALAPLNVKGGASIFFSAVSNHRIFSFIELVVHNMSLQVIYRILATRTVIQGPERATSPQIKTPA
jgi:hypothetical protein